MTDPPAAAFEHGLVRHPARRVKLIAALALCAASMAWAYAVRAFVFFEDEPRWPDGPIVMQLQLGPSPVLTDGSTSWAACAGRALAQWNDRALQGAPVRFDAVGDSTQPIGPGNGVNNVFFSNMIFGMPFGDRTLAVTALFSRVNRNTITEADVIFNSAQSWDCYRGPLRASRDLQRAFLHESGHVLGLDHPDEAGQTVNAIMNSSVSDLDALGADDINGARTLYGAGPLPQPMTGQGIAFPPRDESLAFRRTLEDVYRVNLSRARTSSFVDLEGAVVWTQEYVRYRVNQCDHTQATERVLLQIDGQGIQPVCGVATGTEIAFPPRDQSLAFRNVLEAFYRDDLKRSRSPTFVDNEGDVVWVQEYLRFRVNGCDNAQATARVSGQILGGPVPPVCN